MRELPLDPVAALRDPQAAGQVEDGVGQGFVDAVVVAPVAVGAQGVEAAEGGTDETPDVFLYTG